MGIFRTKNVGKLTDLWIRLFILNLSVDIQIRSPGFDYLPGFSLWAIPKADHLCAVNTEMHLCFAFAEGRRNMKGRGIKSPRSNSLFIFKAIFEAGFVRRGFGGMD